MDRSRAREQSAGGKWYAHGFVISSLKMKEIAPGRRRYCPPYAWQVSDDGMAIRKGCAGSGGSVMTEHDAAPPQAIKTVHDVGMAKVERQPAPAWAGERS